MRPGIIKNDSFLISNAIFQRRLQFPSLRADRVTSTSQAGDHQLVTLPPYSCAANCVVSKLQTSSVRRLAVCVDTRAALPVNEPIREKMLFDDEYPHPPASPPPISYFFNGGRGPISPMHSLQQPTPRATAYRETYAGDLIASFFQPPETLPRLLRPLPTILDLRRP